MKGKHVVYCVGQTFSVHDRLQAASNLLRGDISCWCCPFLAHKQLRLHHLWFWEQTWVVMNWNVFSSFANLLAYFLSSSTFLTGLQNLDHSPVCFVFEALRCPVPSHHTDVASQALHSHSLHYVFLNSRRCEILHSEPLKVQHSNVIAPDI